jgi:large subunit ribosomal protein L35Ae
MKAVIVHFRQGRHHQTPNQPILNVEGVESKEKAEALVGKKVTWKSPADKVLEGEVKAAHGNKGCVRALFEKGLPGQALGKTVELA